MKRKFSVAMMAGVIFMASCFTAFAETLFFNERLAKAVLSAKLTDKNGSVITTAFSSQDSGTGSIVGYVTLSIGSEETEASSVAEINFDGAELDKITFTDFDLFGNYFPGLKTLRLPLPVSCKGLYSFAMLYDYTNSLNGVVFVFDNQYKANISDGYAVLLYALFPNDADTSYLAEVTAALIDFIDMNMNKPDPIGSSSGGCNSVLPILALSLIALTALRKNRRG